MSAFSTVVESHLLRKTALLQIAADQSVIQNVFIQSAVFFNVEEAGSVPRESSTISEIFGGA